MPIAPDITDERIEEIEREHIELYNEYLRDVKSKQITFEQWIETVMYADGDDLK